MPIRYAYTAKRRDNGATIISDTITDLMDQGMGAMATTIRGALIHSHPEAKGLSYDDIDIEMSLAPK